MAASKASLWNQLKAAIKILDENFKYSAKNATNFLGLMDILTGLLEGNHVSSTAGSVESLRANMVSISEANILESIIMELAKNGYYSNATDIATALEDIKTGMILTSETVRYRNWTYGTLTTGASNVGNGIMTRVTTDKNNQLIEAGHYAGGTIKIEADTDKNTGGTSGNESFSIFGTGRPQVDGIETADNTRETASITAKNSTTGMLQNGNFATYTGTGGVDIAFTGWTLTDATKANVSLTSPFRTGGYTAVFTDNNSIVQYLPLVSGSIDITKPVLLIARYMRKTSCDGTLTLRLGSKTITADVSTKTNDVWNDIILGNLSGYGFYDNFKEDSSQNGTRVLISLTSRTTGTLYLGEVVMIQPELFDGKYYAVIAGSTDFLKDDYFSYTDSVANTGRIQTTLARIYNTYLPWASTGETYADA